MPPELSDDHVAAICRVLIDQGVKFVIVGGMAARLHDTGHTTIDVDICPSPDDVNLSHLSDALRELGARLRVEGDPDGVPFEPHPTMLRDDERREAKGHKACRRNTPILHARETASRNLCRADGTPGGGTGITARCAGAGTR